MFYNLTLGYLVQSVSRREPEFAKITDPLVIGPGQVVNVELNERFNFNDGDGRPRYGGLIVSRARLLAAGISHPPTVVDPGSTRATYLTMINHTNFLGPRMDPGRFKIAKMVIFAYEDSEELPEPWQPTEPYELVSEEEMPRFWPPQIEPWRPVRRIDEHDLESLREGYGPPFDIVSVALSNLEQRLEGLRTEVTDTRRVFDTAYRGIEYQQRRLDDMQRELEAAADLSNDQQKGGPRITSVGVFLLCLIMLGVGLSVGALVVR